MTESVNFFSDVALVWLGLALTAWILPGVLPGSKGPLHIYVALTVFCTAVFLFLGVGVSRFLQFSGEAPIGMSSGALIRFSASSAALSALAWAPVLVLRWYSLAQRLEKRRGENWSDGFGGKAP